MEPVSFREIVVGKGEYLHRKGSDLIWPSAVLLVEGCRRVSGARIESSRVTGSLLCSVARV